MSNSSTSSSRTRTQLRPWPSRVPPPPSCMCRRRRVDTIRVVPRVDDAEVVFTSIASPNANHTQGGITRIGAGRMMARGEETGNELRLAMNGNQSARQIVIRKTTNSTGHHKHKRRWGGCKPVQSTGSSSAGGPGYLPIATHRSNTPPPEHRLNMWELS